jgi:hypothetical protein
MAPVAGLSRSLREEDCTTLTTSWKPAPEPMEKRPVGLPDSGSVDHRTVPEGENLSTFWP